MRYLKKFSINEADLAPGNPKTFLPLPLPITTFVIIDILNSEFTFIV